MQTLREKNIFVDAAMFQHPISLKLMMLQSLHFTEARH